MAENAYGLSAESVKKAQATVIEYMNTFRSQSTKFQSDIATERGANWKGEAAEAFTALSETWGQKSRAVIQILQAFHDGLDDTNKAAMAAQMDSIDGLKQAEKQLNDGHLNVRLGG